MPITQSFTGFSEQALEFLEDLADHNERSWFQPRKSIFQQHILEPAQAFVADLGPLLQKLSAGIRYDTATNGRGSLMRIYRDVRFSKDKRPYEPSVRMIFWEGDGKKTDVPGYYLHLDPGGVDVYSGIYMFQKPLLAAYREAIVDDVRGGELVRALHALAAAGDYEIGGESYKRVPTGYGADHPRAPLLRHSGFWTQGPHIPREEMLKPALLEQCFEQCKAMLPIHRWLIAVHRAAG